MHESDMISQYEFYAILNRLVAYWVSVNLKFFRSPQSYRKTLSDCITIYFLLMYLLVPKLH